MTDSRINMRVSKETHEEIKAAAELSREDLTTFVITAALERAEKVVAESRVFKLTAKEVLGIEKMLSEEPQFNQKLHELLNQKNSNKKQALKK